MTSNKIINIGTRLEGRYTVQKLNSAGDVVSELEVKNIITNSGLDFYGLDTASIFPGSCRVGTGTATPTVTDTSLGNQIGISFGTVTSAVSRFSAPDWFTETRFEYNFNLGSVVGNITEVGVSLTSEGDLFSRALFEDELGDPTSITVLADEQLRVFYTLRTYAPTADILETVNGKNLTIRPASFNSSSFGWESTRTPYTTTTGDFRLLPSAIVDANSSPSTTGSLVVQGRTWQPYTAGSFFRDVDLTWGTSVGDGSEYRTIFFGKNSTRWQIGIDPGIVKNDENILDVSLRFSWARV